MNQPRFPESVILSVSKTTLTIARDHEDQLGTMGFNRARLNQFETEIKRAETTPSDLAKRIEIKGLTSTKNEILAECFDWGKKLFTRMEFVFDSKSPEVAAFPSKELRNAEKSENRMMKVMEPMIQLAEKHQSQLAAQGFTPEELDQGKNLLTQLRQADASQELGKDMKTATREERLELFNSLYQTVNQINKAGRLLFKNDSTKRVLFESKWPK
jgi:hypothetical protein